MCEYQLDINEEETAALLWLANTLGRIVEKGSCNAKKAAIVHELIGRLIDHNRELHHTIHDLDDQQNTPTRGRETLN